MGSNGPSAYVTGLTLLAQRELSEAQLRTRLARRQFDASEIDEAVRRLRDERSLDDKRTAVACARTEASLRCRGRFRVLRQIEAMGINCETAKAAVSEVFDEIDETALLERALARRVRHGVGLTDAASVRRIYRYLIAQGFDPARVAALVEERTKNSGNREPEPRIPNPESRNSNDR